jgi:hypothetical protein
MNSQPKGKFHAPQFQASPNAARSLGITSSVPVNAAPPLAPGQVFSGPWQPFDGEGLNNCNGETVHLTGQTLTEMSVTEDASGGVHFLVLLRTRATGEGNTTGSKYVTNEGGHLSEATTSGAYTFTAPFVGTFLSLDTNVPDLHYRFIDHITIDAQGNLRSTITVGEIFCQ